MSSSTSFIFHQSKQLTWSKRKNRKKNIKLMVKIDLCVTVHKVYSLSVRESSFIENIIFHVVIFIALFGFWTSFCLEV